jgi:enamine deaminase RidA (YjgF/YER057c/UK114 family)
MHRKRPQVLGVDLNRSESRSPLPTSTMVEMTKMTSPEYLIEMSDIAVIPH